MLWSINLKTIKIMKRTVPRSDLPLKYLNAFQNMFQGMQVGSIMKGSYIRDKFRQHGLSANTLPKLIIYGILEKVGYAKYRLKNYVISLADVKKIIAINPNTQEAPNIIRTHFGDIIFSGKSNMFDTETPRASKDFFPQPGSMEELRKIVEILRNDVNNIMNTQDRTEQVFRMVGEIKVQYMNTNKQYDSMASKIEDLKEHMHEFNMHYQHVNTARKEECDSVRNHIGKLYAYIDDMDKTRRRMPGFKRAILGALGAIWSLLRRDWKVILIIAVLLLLAHIWGTMR
jgi:hypothetical protein